MILRITLIEQLVKPGQKIKIKSEFPENKKTLKFYAINTWKLLDSLSTVKVKYFSSTFQYSAHSIHLYQKLVAGLQHRQCKIYNLQKNSDAGRFWQGHDFRLLSNDSISARDTYANTTPVPSSEINSSVVS